MLLNALSEQIALYEILDRIRMLCVMDVKSNHEMILTYSYLQI